MTVGEQTTGNINAQLDSETIRLAMLTKRLCADAGHPRLDLTAYVCAILHYAPNSVLHLVGQTGADVAALGNKCCEGFQARMRSCAVPPGD